MAEQGGAAGAVRLDGPARARAIERAADWREQVEHWAVRVDLTPDLGRNIGSLSWWRGLATCLVLCGTTLLMAPGIRAIPGTATAPLAQPHLDQYRAQMISALALGGDSGTHMGPTDAVSALAEAPERPHIELDAALGTGDSFAHILTRSGVSESDAQAALALIRDAVDPASIAAGTRLRMILGRRPNRHVPRPLDRLAVRARLDLALEIDRVDGALALNRIPIAVDDTPLRIRGQVGAGLYRAARAAGAAPSTIQAYLKVLATQLDLGRDVRADDEFDIIVGHRQAATGESETGPLLYAGLTRPHRKDVDLLSWPQDGRDQWYDGSGTGESRGLLARPVSGGRITSTYGRRKHPILGYSRMHAGIDFAAGYGTPIYAAADGKVSFSGRHGGHGNYVKLNHVGGLATGYAHMSRISVKNGERVKRGEIIGYVGSTGLSTGPHLHYELFKNGAAVDPNSVKFTQTDRLGGKALRAFKARLVELKKLPAGLKETIAAQTVAALDVPGGSVGGSQ